MQITDAEFRAFDMDRQVDFASAAEVLDIAIATMFRTAGDRARALGTDLRDDIGGCGLTSVHVLRLGRLRDDAVEGVCTDELAFALVPEGEDVGGGGAAEDAGVDEAGEADVRDVPRGAEDAFEVPDGFCAGLSVSEICSVVAFYR